MKGDMKMKIGDYIETPRFLRVKISEIYEDNSRAVEDGFTEPTHYRDDDYYIRGKVTSTNRMSFAAIRRTSD